MLVTICMDFSDFKWHDEHIINLNQNSIENGIFSIVLLDIWVFTEMDHLYIFYYSPKYEHVLTGRKRQVLPITGTKLYF